MDKMEECERREGEERRIWLNRIISSSIATSQRRAVFHAFLRHGAHQLRRLFTKMGFVIIYESGEGRGEEGKRKREKEEACMHAYMHACGLCAWTDEENGEEHGDRGDVC